MTSLAQPTRGQTHDAPLAADGSPRLPHVAYDDDGYPYSDGAPLGQNSHQIEQIVYAYPALRRWLRGRFPDAFVGSDMFVYWQQGDFRTVVAPDVFVAFGVGGQARLSYKLWEEKAIPAFVLEVLSGTTADRDIGPKRDIYARMGVQELILFDPFGKHVPELVAGFALRGGVYRPVRARRAPPTVRSGVLGVDFIAEGNSLRITDPGTGERLRTLDESEDELTAAQAELTASQAELTASQAEVARLQELLAARDSGPESAG